MKRNILFILFIILSHHIIHAQFAPAEDENIISLVTFGGNAKTSYGDDDFIQVFFCYLICPKHISILKYLILYL